MVDYVFDEKLIKKFDHIDIDFVNPDDESDPRCYVHFYLNDGSCMEYGPYKDKLKAKNVMEKIVDDNVSYKFPFLSEPLKPEKVNIDGALILISETLRTTKFDYINRARELKKHGYKIPTSTKEYVEYGINKQLNTEMEIEKNTLRLLDPVKDKELYNRARERLNRLEELARCSIYGVIKFMEQGALGSLHILNGGLTAQDIMREWKKEALGYGNYPKRYAKHS